VLRTFLGLMTGPNLTSVNTLTQQVWKTSPFSYWKILVWYSDDLYLSQKWYFRPVHRRTSSGHCKCSFFTTGNTKWIIIFRNCTRKHVPHTTLAHTLRLQINRSESCSRPSTESWRSCLVLQGRWVEMRTCNRAILAVLLSQWTVTYRVVEILLEQRGSAIFESLKPAL